MKKLSVLCVLCVVVSVGHASYYMTVDGVVPASTPEIPVGSSVTIGIWSTDTALPTEPSGNTQWGIYHSFSVVAWNGDFTNGNANLTNLVFQPAAGASAYGWTNGAPYDYIASPGWSVLNPADVQAGLWFELTYNALQAGPVVLGLLDGNYAGYQYMNITNVPEPASMGLFALAGLVFLRRIKV